MAAPWPCTLETEIYRVDPKGYYRMRGGYRRYPGSHGYLHRIVWIEANGPIPRGYDVHHVDEDRENCVLENLIVLPRRQHQSTHMRSEKRQAFLASPVGQAAQAKASFARWGRTKPERRTCAACGRSYWSRSTNSRFCEDFCRRALRDLKP